MKKLFALLLTATLVCAMLAMPAAAANNVNYADDVSFVEVAPTMDGVVDSGEYGTRLAKHSFSNNPDQFVTEFDQYGDWDVEFYSAWDAENLYFAWVVKSAVHAGFPSEDFNGDGVANEGDYGYMWEYSCVQFILTPNNPTVGDYTKNYLEVGLCLMDNGDIARVAWNYPTGVNDVKLSSWDAKIKRDDAAGTTTYEVAIPKAMTGFNKYGTGAEFGFSYAVAAQEHFSSVKNGMLEWQDACLGNGGVNIPGNCAVMTLEGGDVALDHVNDVVEGVIPDEAKQEGIVQIAVDKANTEIKNGNAVVFTDFSLNYNTAAYTTNVLLNPVEGEEGVYVVVDAVRGEGEEITFSDLYTGEGAVLLVVHTDTVEGLERHDLAAAALTIDTKVKLFGIDVAEGKLIYTNPMIYTVEPFVPETPDTPDTPDTDVSDDTSDVTSDVPSTDTSDVTSDATSNTTSDKTSSAPSTSSVASTSSAASDADGDSESNLGLIIGIIAGVVVVAGIVVVLVVKKKN